MSNFVRKVFCDGRYDEKIGDGLSFKLPIHVCKIQIQKYMSVHENDV